MNQENMAGSSPEPFAGLLAGKAILVTGGASGLGAALSRTLAGAGAHIMIGDINLDRAREVAGMLGGSERNMHAVQLDVGNPEDAERIIGEAVKCFGKLDVLVNNAGTDVTCSLEELTVADWDRVIRTNLYGPFLLSRQAVQHMKRRRCGHIVNIASTAAKRAWPNAAAYHASKWGLLGLSHALHAELRPDNIKVTAVLAGGMRTPFLLERFPDIDVSTLQDPMSVARAVLSILTLPEETVIPEIMVLPMRETSWP